MVKTGLEGILKKAVLVGSFALMTMFGYQTAHSQILPPQKDASTVNVSFKTRGLTRDTVLNSDLGYKIPNATVSLGDGQFVKVSDNNGEGTFSNIPKGTYTLHLEEPNHKTFDQTFTIDKDTTIYLSTPATAQKGTDWKVTELKKIYKNVYGDFDGVMWKQINPVNATIEGASTSDSTEIKRQKGLMETLSEYELFKFVTNASPDTTYTINMNAGNNTSALASDINGVAMYGWSKIGGADSTTTSHEIITAYDGSPTLLINSNSNSQTQTRVQFQPRDGVMLKITLDQHHRRKNGQQDLWLGNSSDYTPKGMPGAETITSPTNNSVDLDTIVAILGTKDNNAQFYHIQIASDSGATNIIAEDSTLDRPNTTFKGKQNTTYFARMRSKNNQGTGTWSTPTKFTTKKINTAPTPFSIVKPTEGDTVKYNNVQIPIKWNRSTGTGTLTYIIGLKEAGVDTNITTIITQDTLGNIPSHILGSNKKYTLNGKVTNGTDTVSATNTPSFYTTTLTDVVKINDNTPKEFKLEQNYPNPFNPTTKVQYSLKQNAHVTLEVYNMLGQKVREIDEGIQHSGTYTEQINGSGLSSGLYLLRMSANPTTGTQKPYSQTIKMLLEK